MEVLAGFGGVYIVKCSFIMCCFYMHNRCDSRMGYGGLY